MGQFSDRIAVGDSTPYEFTIDNGQRFFLVAFRWEDASGNEVSPAGTGRRTVTASYVRLRGYVTGQTPGFGPDISIGDPRLADPATFVVQDDSVGNFDTVDASINSLRLTSVETIATPGATHYRYFVTTTPVGGTSGVT